MTIAIEYSKKFELKNNEVRAYYLEKLETDNNLNIKINELVEIVHEELEDWSLNKIAQHICMVNEDLDNFSSKTVYNQISSENRILLGVDIKPTSAENRRKRKLQNNVMEPSFESVQDNVIEDSSIDETQQQGPRQQQQNNNNKKLGFPDYAEELIKNQATKPSIPTTNEMKTTEEETAVKYDVQKLDEVVDET